MNRPGRWRPRNHCLTVISETEHPRAAKARRNCGKVRPARFACNTRQSGSRGGNSFFRLIVCSARAEHTCSLFLLGGNYR